LPLALVAAVLAGLSPAVAETPAAAVAPPAVQSEFVAFLARFRAALKAKDAAAIAGMTRMTLDEKSYMRELTEKRACVLREKAVYDRDPSNNDTYAIFCGEVLFGFTKTASGFLFTDISPND
jgi:hypothetical protein